MKFITHYPFALDVQVLEFSGQSVQAICTPRDEDKTMALRCQAAGKRSTDPTGRSRDHSCSHSLISYGYTSSHTFLSTRLSLHDKCCMGG